MPSILRPPSTETDADHAPRVRHVLHADEVALVPVQAVDAAGDDAVGLRQALRRAVGVEAGDAGRERDVDGAVGRDGDAVDAARPSAGPCSVSALSPGRMR